MKSFLYYHQQISSEAARQSGIGSEYSLKGYRGNTTYWLHGASCKNNGVCFSYNLFEIHLCVHL